MKRLIFLLLAFFAFACTTTTSDKSFEMAKAGNYKVDMHITASQEALKNATLEALSGRKWNVNSIDKNIINASINHGGVCAVLKITVENDYIIFDSKGSTADSVAIVPLRMINYLQISIKKNLNR